MKFVVKKTFNDHFNKNRIFNIPLNIFLFTNLTPQFFVRFFAFLFIISPFWFFFRVKNITFKNTALEDLQFDFDEKETIYSSA